MASEQLDTPSLAPFRFLDLPYDIQQHIFEYTDLITPFREIEWRSGEGFRVRYNLRWCLGEKCPPHLHHACQYHPLEPAPSVSDDEEPVEVSHPPFEFNDHFWEDIFEGLEEMSLPEVPPVLDDQNSQPPRETSNELIHEDDFTLEEIEAFTEDTPMHDGQYSDGQYSDYVPVELEYTNQVDFDYEYDLDYSSDPEVNWYDSNRRTESMQFERFDSKRRPPRETAPRKQSDWAPPTALFLVSWAFYRESLDFLLRKNRMIVYYHERQADMPANRLEASIFLTAALPATALVSLRYLEIVVPRFTQDRIRPVNAFINDWLRTMDLLSVNTFHQLTMRFYLPSSFCGLRFPNGDPSSRGCIPTCLVDFYSTMLKPLCRLRGLEQFFVVIYPSYCCYERGCHHIYEYIKLGLRKYTGLEDQLERLVMGVDYDSSKLGKEDQCNSQWLENHLLEDGRDLRGERLARERKATGGLDH